MLRPRFKARPTFSHAELGCSPSARTGVGAEIGGFISESLEIFRSPDPAQEKRRIEAIHGLDIAGMEDQDVLSPIVEEAARNLRQPIALITLVLRNTQHFLALHGLGGWLKEAGGTPREWAFCHHVVSRGCCFIVEDATKHPLMASSPLVTRTGIRTYAGVPLKDESGVTLGSLCVLGNEPRNYSSDDIQHLQELALRATRHLLRAQSGQANLC